MQPPTASTLSTYRPPHLRNANQPSASSSFALPRHSTWCRVLNALQAQRKLPTLPTTPTPVDMYNNAIESCCELHTQQAGCSDRRLALQHGLEILSWIREDRLEPNATTFNALIRQASLVRDCETAMLLLDQMEASSIRPSCETIRHLVESCEGHPDGVRRAFEFLALGLDRQAVFEGGEDHRVFHSLLRVCMSSRDVDSCLKVLGLMGIAAILISQDDVTTLINLLSPSGTPIFSVDELGRAHNRLRQAGGRLTLEAYHLLLQHALELDPSVSPNSAVTVFDLADHLRTDGLTPTTETLNLLLRTCANMTPPTSSINDGEEDEVSLLLAERLEAMLHQTQGLSPDPVTISLAKQCKKRNPPVFAAVRKFAATQQQQQPPVTTDAGLDPALLEKFHNVKLADSSPPTVLPKRNTHPVNQTDPADMLKKLRKMPTTTLIAYNMAIQKLCLQAEAQSSTHAGSPRAPTNPRRLALQRGLEILGWIREDRLEPNATTFASLIRQASIVQACETAMLLFDQMEASSIRPSCEIMLQLIESCEGQTDAVRKAFEFLQLGYCAMG